MLGKTLALIVAVAGIGMAIPALAGQSSRNVNNVSQREFKYDIAMLEKDGAVFAWGNWNSDEWKQLRESKDTRLFVKKDGKGYFISDRKTIDAVRKAAQPVIDLGKQQGELGQKQGQLGRQQGELGRKQGELGRWIGDLVRENADGDRKDYERKMKQYNEESKSLAEQQRRLGDKQRELGEQQRKLGEKQRVAGKKAASEMTKIIDEAFEKGLAVPAG